MELKTAGGLPLWMSHELGRLGIYRTSFSKYGKAYQHIRERGAHGARNTREIPYV